MFAQVPERGAPHGTSLVPHEFSPRSSPMPAFGSGRILSALVLITACSAMPADARWRHYGYHWYGRAWYNYQNHGDEVRGDHAPAAEDKNSARYQGRGFWRYHRANDTRM